MPRPKTLKATCAGRTAGERKVRLVSLRSIAGLVMKYANRVKKLRKQLLDAAGAEIIVVTIPEAMGVAEMNRLIEALRKFKIASRQIVINMVTPPNDCSFCSLKRNEEQRYVREVIAQCPDHQVTCVPRLPHSIRGLTTLFEFKRILWGDTTRKEPRNRSRSGATADLAPSPASLHENAGTLGTVDIL